MQNLICAYFVGLQCLCKQDEKCMRDEERLIVAPQKRDRGNGSKELVSKVGVKLSDDTLSIKTQLNTLGTI